jgi:hypothetical protein
MNTTHTINAEVYTTAAALTVDSKFKYVGIEYTVTGFSGKTIYAISVAGKKFKATAHEFEGYMYYGFLTVVK